MLKAPEGGTIGGGPEAGKEGIGARAGHSATALEGSLDGSLVIFGGTRPGQARQLLCSAACFRGDVDSLLSRCQGSTMVYQHTLLLADVHILDTDRQCWLRPAVSGEPPKGRGNHSAWLVSGKPRLLITLGEKAEDGDKVRSATL